MNYNKCSWGPFALEENKGDFMLDIKINISYDLSDKHQIQLFCHFPVLRNTLYGVQDCILLLSSSQIAQRL